MRILFISDHINEENNGASLVSNTNLEIIKELHGDNVITIAIGKKEEVDKKKYDYFFNVSKNRKEMLYNVLQGNYKLINNKVIKSIIRIINNESIECVFIDNSMYGTLAKLIKKQTNSKIFVFFHDVKRNLYKSELKNKGVKFLPTYITTVINEKMTVRYSDKIICLNDRENNEIYKYYNRMADLINPITIKDKIVKLNINRQINNKILFVGTANHLPNVKGIKWFVENVFKDVDNIKLYIVGNQTEKIKIQNNNVYLTGKVEDLSEYYNEADIVICPIFEGAGMKVKVAEAMMYGKVILGTTEALIGYDFKNNEDLILCNTANQFTKAIKEYYSKPKLVSTINRDEFLRKYEYNSGVQNYKKLFSKEGRDSI